MRKIADLVIAIGLAIGMIGMMGVDSPDQWWNVMFLCVIVGFSIAAAGEAWRTLILKRKERDRRIRKRREAEQIEKKVVYYRDGSVLTHNYGKDKHIG